MIIKSIRGIENLTEKTVLLRSDFNVPIKKGKVSDDYKIVAGLPTLRYLLRYKCKIVVATHLGDPAGKAVKSLSTKPVASKLEALLGQKVKFIPDSIGKKAEEEIGKMKPGEIVFLENLRFNKGEEKNDKVFASELAKLADIYINNAFAVSHRAQASVSAIKKYMPAYAGLLVELEVMNLEKALNPAKPLVVVIGGAKISTKLPIIKNFIKRADHILIGGAIANDFLRGLDYEIGKSVASKDKTLAADVVKLYKKVGNEKIILPLDLVVSDKLDGSGKLDVKSLNNVAKNDIILDIGPKTIGFYARFLKQANTIVWNGPMGLYENKHFKHGTLGVARVIASRSRGESFGVAGGGETIEALKLTKMFDDVDWVSTGGGAMLDYLGGEKMPGLEGIIN